MIAASRALVALTIMAAFPPAASRAQEIHGTLLADSTSRPVVAAEVSVLDTLGSIVAQATSDSSGGFIVEVSPGFYSFRVLRLGYRPTLSTVLRALEATDEIKVTIRVPSESALGEGRPHALSPIIVEAQSVDRHLAEFYRHQELGEGEFLLREDFERYAPSTMTDVLMRVPGFSVVPNPRYMQQRSDGSLDTRQHIITVPGAGFRHGQNECAPLLYLDGAFLGSSGDVDVDMLPVNAISAVEAYGSAISVPIEYRRPDSECGIIALWTRSGETGERGSPFELGVRYGGTVAGGAFVGGRLGVHLVTPFVGPLEFYPALYLVSSAFSSSQTPENSSWMAQIATRVMVRKHPLSVYIGGGLVLVKQDRWYVNVMEDVDIDTKYTVFASVVRDLGPLRPFLDLHLLDALTPSTALLQTYLGIGVEF